MASFGEILKRERELRGISLREISEATKISIRHLDALEDSRIADLPGGLFNKGFIRAYALHVGIDPDEMVNNYLYDVGQMEEQDPLESLRALIPVEQNSPVGRWRQWVVLGAIFGGGLLLLAGPSFWPLRDRSPTAPVAILSAEPDPDPAAAIGTTVQEDAGGRESEPPADVPAAGEPLANGRPEIPANREPAMEEAAEPVVQPDPPPAARSNPAPDRTDLTFEMEMRHPARVRILCDGNEVLNKRLGTGERRLFTCRDLRLSASDAAALRYRVNDNAWVIPDDTGSPLENLHFTPAAFPNRAPGDDAAAGTAGTPAGTAPWTEEEV
jgi:cytoskeletal protein RodZ